MRRESTLRNKRCIVIGSAPDPNMWDYQDDDAIICVKASGLAARTLGVRDPDLTIMTGWNHIKFKDALNGLRTKKFMHIHPSTYMLGLSARGAEDYVQLDSDLNIIKWYKDNNFIFDEFETASLKEIEDIANIVISNNYLRIFGRVLTEDLSIGIFAIAYALWSGATEIIAVGINPYSIGHVYTGQVKINGEVAQPTLRRHSASDVEAIIAMYKSGFKISTTEPTLAKCTGIPLLPSRD
jgi:hypothetical protein